MSDEKIVIQLSLEKDEASVNKTIGSIKKSVKRDIGGSFKSAAKVIAGATAAVTGFAAVAVAAAAREEQAIARLNASLAASGELTSAVSQDLQNFANQLQKTTTFGNEAALEQLAFAKAMGATAQQSKQVVSAAANLATALDIDLNSATRNVAKTLGGYAGELGEVIPELKNFTQEQLRAGAGVDLLARKFAGIAASQTKTFSGAIQQFGNLFGDFLERVGELITKSPLAIKTLNALSSMLANAANKIADIGKNGDAFKDFIDGTIKAGMAINKYLVLPLELLFNIGKTVFRALVAWNSKLFSIMVEGATVANNILKKIGVDTGLEENLKTLGESSDEVFNESFADFEESKNRVFDFKGALAVDETLTELQRFADESAAPLEQVETNFKKTSDNIGKSIKKTVTDVSQLIKSALAGGIVTATQMMVNALMNGGASVKDFGKLFLNVIGDMATNVGKTLILTGLGINALTSLQGGAAIAAGIGLVAIGQIIKNLAGGGESPSGGVGAGGGGVGAAGAGGVEETPITQTEQEEKVSSVNVTIEGDVLGDESAGTRIVELINSAFDAEGAQINLVT